MKVLHFFKTYQPDTTGGIEQVINQIATSTQHLGIETQVLSLSPNKTAQPQKVDGHTAYSVPTHLDIASTPMSLAAFARFSQLARESDIIHYHYPYPFADMLHFICGVKSRLNKPSLVTYHSDIIKQKHLDALYSPLRNRFLASVDRIVATSPNYLATSETLSRFKGKTSVIPIGIAPPVASKSSPAKIKTWHKRFGPRFFLFMGVLRYYKGLHFLLRAAQNLPHPIVIAGAGPLEHELKAQARALNLTNVHFTGFVSDEDKPSLFDACYAFVFPSHLRSEAFGVSLLEAAMHAKPLICCEIGTGTSYINIAGETGLVIPAEDPKALQHAMQKLIDDGPLARQMGISARARYKKYFTAKKMGKFYCEIYRNLLRHSR